MRNKILKLFVLLLAGMLALSGCGGNAGGKTGSAAPQATAELTAAEAPAVTAEPGPMAEAQRLADYLFEHGELPENFLTKQEAKDLGWDSSWNYVSDVAPGMSIGGDYFGNYEGKLPKIKGRKYYECDCWYTGGKRNAYRIIYSNDGHVWYTKDHYNTFTEMSPSEKSASEKSVSGP